MNIQDLLDKANNLNFSKVKDKVLYDMYRILKTVASDIDAVLKNSLRKEIIGRVKQNGVRDDNKYVLSFGDDKYLSLSLLQDKIVNDFKGQDFIKEVVSYEIDEDGFKFFAKKNNIDIDKYYKVSETEQLNYK